MVFARAVKDVFVVAAKRTPFGTYGGKLTKFTATDLQEIAAKAALTAGNVNPEIIDSVIVGNVCATSKDGAYISRHAAIRAGVPISSPAVTVNRLCGSGFQSIVQACQEISVGDCQVVMTGGAENMSQAPHVIRGARFGIRLGLDLPLEDSLWATLTDHQFNIPMGVTAENLAKKYELTREECDAFALLSQQRWKAANDKNAFQDEMAPVTIKSKKGDVTMDTDEHPREVTLAALGKLPSVFMKNGTVSAGNASGICDGAGCVIVASAEAVKQHNLTPLARIAGYSVAGCDPSIMGIGPVPAIEALLQKTDVKLADVDYVEVNEAFAPQVLSCIKALGLDPAKVNVNGGAIALGHPVGASGARITAHLSHHLRAAGGKYAIGSACIGGGQGIALLLEKC
jgi:acetyl-CoA acyltransferase 2